MITAKYVRRYEDHPLKEFLARGLLVTLNTDDPVLFDIELNDEYSQSAEKLGLGAKGVAMLLRNGIKASFMDEKRKTAALAELELALTAAAVTP